MFVLEPIAPTRLHEVWPMVLPGLHKILDKTGTTDDWQPEDVYAACKFGISTLYLAWHQRQLVGHTVLEVQTNPHSGRQKLLIWTAYLEDPHAFDLALTEIERIAGSMPVTFQSPRAGWVRKMESRGYHVSAFTLEKQPK